MQIRDRIKELRRVKASLLEPHPRNWRTHPQAQQDALRGILAEVGYADALLARQREDGTLELIDGHLRAETTPDMEVPVLVLDLTAEEAEKLLAVLDPLAAMAGADRALQRDLMANIHTQSAGLQALLTRMRREADDEAPKVGGDAPWVAAASFQLVVECPNEEVQRQLFEQLTGQGLKCRVLVI